MSKLAIGCVGLLWSLLSWAQDIPSVAQWASTFEEVRQHTLFKALEVRYAKAPARNVGYTPIGVVLGEGAGCKVVIAEGDNYKMRSIMRFGPTPHELRTLMLTAAAHELGHCLRLRQRQMPSNLWSLVAASSDGTPERHAFERQASFEEAFADAYALAYIRDANPALFPEALQQMKALRASPSFATPYYQVQPLYDELEQRGFDAQLPVQQQVEAIMQMAKFQFRPE